MTLIEQMIQDYKKAPPPGYSLAQFLGVSQEELDAYFNSGTVPPSRPQLGREYKPGPRNPPPPNTSRRPT